MLMRLPTLIRLTKCATAFSSTIPSQSKMSLTFKQHFFSITLKRMLCTKVYITNDFDNKTAIGDADFSSPNKNDRNKYDRNQSLPVVVMDYSELEKDAETKKNIEIILMEQSLVREEGGRAPSVISVKDMKELLTYGYYRRKNYMSYLFKNEVVTIERKKKHKAKVDREGEEKKLNYQLEGDHLHYGLAQNTIFLMIRPKSLHNYYMARLSHSIIHGQKLVFDFSFGQHMSKQEAVNAAKQLKICYAANKIEKDPLSLHFTNIRPDNDVFQHVKLAIGNISTTSMITVSEDSYLDHYPKEKLVYLTPDAPNMLEKYDHDAVYIIGVIVDKGPSIPLTLAKAKREGIKMARLPLEQHLLWGMGGKSLTLNHVVEILLDVKEHNNWEKALLRGVPSRKLAKLDLEKERFKSKEYQLDKKKYQLRKREDKLNQLEKQEFFKYNRRNESTPGKLGKIKIVDLLKEEIR